MCDVTVNGDLIIGDGVGDSEVILDNVIVTGRLIVRGGGENSIRITGGSEIDSIIISKAASGAVRVYVTADCSVDMVYVNDGADDIILEGFFNSVTVQSATPVVMSDATVNLLSIASAGATVALEGNTVVTTAEITEAAVGATVTMDAGAVISNLENNADDANIACNVTSFAELQSANDDVNVTAINIVGSFSITEDITLSKTICVAQGCYAYSGKRHRIIDDRDFSMYQ